MNAALQVVIPKSSATMQRNEADASYSMIPRCHLWPTICTQPPPRTSHLRYCDITFYEALAPSREMIHVLSRTRFWDTFQTFHNRIQFEVLGVLHFSSSFTTSPDLKSSSNWFTRLLKYFPINIDQNQPINTIFKKILPFQIFYVLSSNKIHFF